MADVTYNLQPASAARGYLLAGIGAYHLTFAVKSGAVAWFIETRYLDVGAFETIKPTLFSTATGVRFSIGGR